MDKPKVFLIIPFKSDFEDIYQSISQAVMASSRIPTRIDEADPEPGYFSDIESAIKKAEIIIADISEANPNVMYEVGIAQSLSKPLILLCQKGEEVAFDLKRFNILFYDRKQLSHTLTIPLRRYLERKNLTQFISSERIELTKKKEEIKTVFISYSHADTTYLNRLMIHLRPFEKNGVIDLWVDTKIKVGEKWKDKIKQALDKSALAILLISADFLASDFIIDNELPPLLQAAEKEGKLILPVIIKPCRFIRDEHLSQFQAINDPQIPLSKLDENGREEIYVKVVLS